MIGLLWLAVGDVKMMSVQMQLARIIISEISDNQVIYLQEIGGERQFPILIGIFEAIDASRKTTTPLVL